MNTTINISLGGLSFCIDESAYSLLQNYLRNVESNLGSHTDKQDVMNDIEARMAELFSDLLKSQHQTVVSVSMVQAVIDQLGKPDDYKEPDDETTLGEKTINYTKNLFRKHLYRDTDNQIIAGVCSGLGHWFGIGAGWIRLLFVLCLFLWGFTAILYVILWLIVPEARTAAQRLEMRGETASVENIEREVANLSNTANQQSDKSGCANILVMLLKIAVWIIGGFFIFVAGSVLLSVIVALFAALTGLAVASPIGMFATFFGTDSWVMILLIVLLLVIVGLPIFGLVYIIINYAKNGEKVSSKAIGWSIVIWLLSLLTCVGIGVWQLATNEALAESLDLQSEPWHLLTDNNDDDAPMSQMAVMPFHSIVVKGAADVNLEVDSQQFIEASLRNDDLFDYDVTDSVLTIKANKKRVRLNIHTPYMRKMSFAGAAKLKTNNVLSSYKLQIDASGASDLDLNLQVQQLDIKAQGASDIELEGSADNLKLDLAGASKVDAEDFTARVGHVVAVGASKVEINVTDSLAAYPSGASKIIYKGTPIVQSEVRSGGKIKHSL